MCPSDTPGPCPAPTQWNWSRTNRHCLLLPEKHWIRIFPTVKRTRWHCRCKMVRIITKGKLRNKWSTEAILEMQWQNRPSCDSYTSVLKLPTLPDRSLAHSHTYATLPNSPGPLKTFIFYLSEHRRHWNESHLKCECVRVCLKVRYTNDLQIASLFNWFYVTHCVKVKKSLLPPHSESERGRERDETTGFL